MVSLSESRKECLPFVSIRHHFRAISYNLKSLKFDQISNVRFFAVNFKRVNYQNSMRSLQVFHYKSFSVDSSEYMRNGDFVPNRLVSLQDAAQLVIQAKLRGNPENAVGLLAMNG